MGRRRPRPHGLLQLFYMSPERISKGQVGRIERFDPSLLTCGGDRLREQRPEQFEKAVDGGSERLVPLSLHL
jgi:hypothetical protein